MSRNGPWERLAWTQRTLGRVNEKNETPRRFSSIFVQRTPISGFGLWAVPLALFWGDIMSHKHKNLSYLLASTTSLRLQSHQGVSRNGPWERLAWTQRTLGRVNEKKGTPHRFSSISVQRTPISGFGLWAVPLVLFWEDIMSHKHKNLSYLFASTFKKFIKNTSLAWSLLRAKLSCKFTSIKVYLCTTRKCWEMPFLLKKCGPLYKNGVNRGFCPSGRAGELSLSWKSL